LSLHAGHQQQRRMLNAGQFAVQTTAATRCNVMERMQMYTHKKIRSGTARGQLTCEGCITDEHWCYRWVKVSLSIASGEQQVEVKVTDEETAILDGTATRLPHSHSIIIFICPSIAKEVEPRLTGPVTSRPSFL